MGNLCVICGSCIELTMILICIPWIERRQSLWQMLSMTRWLFKELGEEEGPRLAREEGFVAVEKVVVEVVVAVLNGPHEQMGADVPRSHGELELPQNKRLIPYLVALQHS
jgi:hypothetical protein